MQLYTCNVWLWIIYLRNGIIYLIYLFIIFVKISVTAVRFANNDKSLIACSSLDGKLSICQLTPSPASVLYLLNGHKAGITGNVDFLWTTVIFHSYTVV